MAGEHVVHLRRGGVWLLVLVCLLLAACGGSGPSTSSVVPTPTIAPNSTATASALPHFSHVFVIVMENESYDGIIGNSNVPYINSLAQKYSLATNYYAISHPSLPNYLALTGGSTFGVTSDCLGCYQSANNLVDALTAGHKTWKAYMESMPAMPCYTGNAYPYAKRHDPFIYYDDIRTTPGQCANIVPFTQFTTDLANNSLPDFSWITPNVCHDMHDCSPTMGDSWLQSIVPGILASPAWQHGGALFITWDEGEHDDSGCCTYAQGGHVATLVISPLARAHFTSAVAYDHYSLLRTICESWGLTPPGNAASPATPVMSDFFATGS